MAQEYYQTFPQTYVSKVIVAKPFRRPIRGADVRFWHICDMPSGKNEVR